MNEQQIYQILKQKQTEKGLKNSQLPVNPKTLDRLKDGGGIQLTSLLTLIDFFGLTLKIE